MPGRVKTRRGCTDSLEVRPFSDRKSAAISATSEAGVSGHFGALLLAGPPTFLTSSETKRSNFQDKRQARSSLQIASDAQPVRSCARRAQISAFRLCVSGEV